MITFEDMCRRNGLDPEATRKIINGNYTVTVTHSFENDDKSKREAMVKLLQWVHDNWVDGVDVTKVSDK